MLATRENVIWCFTLRLSEKSKFCSMQISSKVEASWERDREDGEDMVYIDQVFNCSCRKNQNPVHIQNQFDYYLPYFQYRNKWQHKGVFWCIPNAKLIKYVVDTSSNNVPHFHFDPNNIIECGQASCLSKNSEEIRVWVNKPKCPPSGRKKDYNLVCLLLTTHFHTQNSFSPVFKKAIEKLKKEKQKLFPLHMLSLCSWVPNNAKEVKIQIRRSKTYSYCSDVMWCDVQPKSTVHTNATTLLNPLNKVLRPRKEIGKKKSRQWWCLASFFIYLFSTH